MNDKTTEIAWTLINRAADLLRFDAFHSIGGALESYTVPQQNVLGVVFTHSDTGLMVKDIAAKISVTCGAVSQTVESLVKLGMLERVNSTQDRRAVFVRTTPKGVEIRKELIEKTAPILTQILFEAESAGHASFIGILEKPVEQLTAMNKTGVAHKTSARKDKVAKTGSLPSANQSATCRIGSKQYI